MRYLKQSGKDRYEYRVGDCAITVKIKEPDPEVLQKRLLNLDNKIDRILRRRDY